MKYLLLLDYDGTLTPIVERPENARLTARRKKILRELSLHSEIKMAIISGRKLSDIKRLVGIPHLIYAGNHGFEIEIDRKHITVPAAKSFIPTLKKVKTALSALSNIEGVLIEDKSYTLSVHFRLVPSSRLKTFRQLFYQAIHPWQEKVKVTRGKKVLEIRPPVNWDKGKAVKWIMNKLNIEDHFPIYIGDDRTDEDAFRALKGKGLSLQVGAGKKTAADYRLKNVEAVYSYLRSLVKNESKSPF